MSSPLKRSDTVIDGVAFEMSRFNVIQPVRGQQRIVWLHRARRDRGRAETVVVMAVFFLCAHDEVAMWLGEKIVDGVCHLVGTPYRAP